MSDAIANLTENLKGKAKEVAGDALGNDDLKDEGQAQQQKAEAAEEQRRLEELADEKQQEKAGYKGEQKSQAQDA